MSIEESKENINFAKNVRKMRDEISGRHATNEVMKDEMKEMNEDRE